MTRQTERTYWLLALYAVAVLGHWAGVTDAEDERIVARCPNWDSTIVTPTPWERDHGRKPRTIPAPPCEETP